MEEEAVKKPVFTRGRSFSLGYQINSKNNNASYLKEKEKGLGGAR